MRKRTIAILFLVIAVGIASAYAGLEQSHTPLLTVYVADAYTQEAQFMLSAFHNSTGIQGAIGRAGGAFVLAREIAQNGGADVFISVSLQALDKAYLRGGYSGWGIAFASDQMVIAYAPHTQANSAEEKIINDFASANATGNRSAYFQAFDALTSGSVKVGISNPEEDPAGYRAWLVLEMAGNLYANNTTFFSHNALSNNAVITAGSAANLVSPLESDYIQFLFIYKSAAIAKHLNYIELPNEINLGYPSFASFYSNFTYPLSTGNVSGSPIYLLVTVPANSLLTSYAFQFVDFIVQNSSLLLRFGLHPLHPSLLFSSESNAHLDTLLKSGEIVNVGGI
ncbi:MAG: extracellular solute-binding protein [Methanomassiliicoccales archaeon]